ncbi:MAG TPA: hypothetical protein LFW11_06490 [Rickettsia endosymbiont of Proechinophthirus fluctus]|uniref:hypothetical protein n=1 Tax=Rickettsia endosymbiont of Proechinophthirus fluctus TaxID=1462733 RepID=UPI0009FE18EE|nr:hypothetical protein [Rickettsia endosymbiont of Proechinophthirus fluctus]HJD54953.1 hypothetical protein [Rickettsia endosymbiont of Proechinophthirus fluctus]
MYYKILPPKFNQTISPTPFQKRLKLSLSKRKDIYDANDDDNNQTLETTDIDNSMKEYSKLIGEHTNTIYD